MTFTKYRLLAFAILLLPAIPLIALGILLSFSDLIVNTAIAALLFIFPLAFLLYFTKCMLLFILLSALTRALTEASMMSA